MLIALQLHKFTYYNLKVFGLFTPALIQNERKREKNSENFINKLRTAKESESAFRLRSYVCILYTIAVCAQVIHALEVITISVLVQSLLYSAVIASHLPVVLEHYLARHELANLYNAFLDFEIRNNRKLS